MNLRRERPFLVINQDYINQCESGSYTLEVLAPDGQVYATNAYIVNNTLYKENNFGESRPLRVTDRKEGIDPRWRLTYNGPWVEDCADIEKFERFMDDFKKLGDFV